jgi:hypothetical protein
MWRDLRVVSYAAPSIAALVDWVRGQAGWDASSSGGSIVVERGTRQGKAGFSIDGPLRIDAEDLPSELAAAVLMPRWTLDLSLPAGSPDLAWAMVVKTGRYLADMAEGVLFDPQEDRIVWPRSQQRRLARSEGERTTHVEFSWVIPAGAFAEALPRRLLATFRRRLPEALPRRYGAFEPLQHRLEEGDDAFVSRWLEEQGSAVGLLFWKGSTPVGEGFVSFPSDQRPDLGIPAGSVQFQVDGRVFDDARWRELAFELLDEIGELSSAFYSRALVEQRRGGGIPASEFGALPPPVVSRGAWSGLPDHPAWLTWLGPGYAGIVDVTMPASVKVARRHGSIVRLSERPLLASELLPWVDRFPPEYCRLPDPPSTDRAQYLERYGGAIRPAVRIPVGDRN